MTLELKNVNLSTNLNNSIRLHKYNDTSDYIVTYGIYTTYLFDTSDVKFVYGIDGYSTESNLQLWKCGDYDFDSKTCNGSLSDITSSASQNITGHYFTYTTSTFSSFNIKEYIAPVVSSGGGNSNSNGNESEVCDTEGYEIVNGTCVKLVAEEEIIENNTVAPKELFDIRMDLEETSIDFSSELMAIVTYESFGSIPTLVNLTFEVFDLDLSLFR